MGGCVPIIHCHFVIMLAGRPLNHIKDFMEHGEMKLSKCQTCGQRKRRSLPQNAYLHQLVTTISESIKSKDGEYHSAQWWKVMLKAEFLGFSEFRRPDGQVIQVLISTADLDVDRFNEFITKVEAFAASRGVYLP